MFRAKSVLTTDPYVKNDAELLDVKDVVRRSDVLILCVPHKAYRDLELGQKIVVDIWNFWQMGSMFHQTQSSVGSALK
jgi:UDP-N-acetyl-D-mannosaminuronic acid dehydrogenase